MNKVRKLFLSGNIIVFLSGALFICFGTAVLKITGAVLILLSIVSAVFLSGKANRLPLPDPLKVFFIMSVFMKPAKLITSLFGISEDDILLFLVEMNNSLYKGRKFFGKVLILLPKCIQNTECAVDLISDIANCIACGKCQVKDIIKLSYADRINLFLVGGGRLAVKKVRELDPDCVIAVACEVELIEGICAIYNKPVVAVVNNRPCGPCKNTDINMENFKNKIEEVLG